MRQDPKFHKGDFVRKFKGAKFWGQIMNEPYRTLGEEWHYDVMAIHPDFAGTVHILVETQIETIKPPYSNEIQATPLYGYS